MLTIRYFNEYRHKWVFFELVERGANIFTATQRTGAVFLRLLLCQTYHKKIGNPFKQVESHGLQPPVVLI